MNCRLNFGNFGGQFAVHTKGGWLCLVLSIIVMILPGCQVFPFQELLAGRLVLFLSSIIIGSLYDNTEGYCVEIMGRGYLVEQKSIINSPGSSSDLFLRVASIGQ